MKLISWNVNGINACAKKGLADFIKKSGADVVCLQETKAKPEKSPAEIAHLQGYKQYWHSAEKPGYSGVLTLVKDGALSVTKGIGISEFDSEGRVLVTEHEKFYLLNCYFPNSQRELTRLDYKMRFNSAFLKFCKKLEKKKPVIVTGDLNVSHTELDIKNAKANEKNAGFTIEERDWFSAFLDVGFIDTFRMFEKEGGHYTWWSYRFNARERNIGWRLDYFAVSKKLEKAVKSSKILKDVMGSDHCPVELDIN